MEKLSKTLSVILLLSLFSCTSQTTVQCQGKAMSLPYKVIVVASFAEKEKIEDLIKQSFDQINSSANSWNLNSEISSISKSKSKEPIAISSLLYRLLSTADQIYHLTHHRFDPTIAPIMKTYQGNHFQKDLPLGWNNIQLTDGSVQKKKTEIAFDLCGIAKGFCIDLIAESLLDHGYKDFLIEWAGDIRAHGSNVNDLPWVVSVNGIEEILLENHAIATSSYFMPRYWEDKNKHYSHIIDPINKKALSVEDAFLSAVSVQAKSCAVADALATAMMTFTSKDELFTLVKKLTTNDKDLTIWVTSKEKI